MQQANDPIHTFLTLGLKTRQIYFNKAKKYSAQSKVAELNENGFTPVNLPEESLVPLDQFPEEEALEMIQKGNELIAAYQRVECFFDDLDTDDSKKIKLFLTQSRFVFDLVFLMIGYFTGKYFEYYPIKKQQAHEHLDKAMHKYAVALDMVAFWRTTKVEETETNKKVTLPAGLLMGSIQWFKDRLEDLTQNHKINPLEVPDSFVIFYKVVSEHMNIYQCPAVKLHLLIEFSHLAERVGRYYFALEIASKQAERLLNALIQDEPTKLAVNPVVLRAQYLYYLLDLIDRTLPTINSKSDLFDFDLRCKINMLAKTALDLVKLEIPKFTKEHNFAKNRLKKAKKNSQEEKVRVKENIKDPQQQDKLQQQVDRFRSIHTDVIMLLKQMSMVSQSKWDLSDLDERVSHIPKSSCQRRDTVQAMLCARLLKSVYELKGFTEDCQSSVFKNIVNLEAAIHRDLQAAFQYSEETYGYYQQHTPLFVDENTQQITQLCERLQASETDAIQITHMMSDQLRLSNEYECRAACGQLSFVFLQQYTAVMRSLKNYEFVLAAINRFEEKEVFSREEIAYVFSCLADCFVNAPVELHAPIVMQFFDFFNYQIVCSDKFKDLFTNRENIAPLVAHVLAGDISTKQFLEIFHSFAFVLGDHEPTELLKELDQENFKKGALYKCSPPASFEDQAAGHIKLAVYCLYLAQGAEAHYAPTLLRWVAENTTASEHAELILQTNFFKQKAKVMLNPQTSKLPSPAY